MKILLLVTLTLGLAACSDTVTTIFPTLADAKREKAFERGWLPPILPPSAKNIVEINDLDVNIGSGLFDYDPAQRDSYISKLVTDFSAFQEGSVLIVKINKSLWTIKLPKDSGKGTYSVQSKIQP